MRHGHVKNYFHLVEALRNRCEPHSAGATPAGNKVLHQSSLQQILERTENKSISSRSFVVALNAIIVSDVWSTSVCVDNHY